MAPGSALKTTPSPRLCSVLQLLAFGCFRVLAFFHVWSVLRCVRLGRRRLSAPAGVLCSPGV